MIFRISSALLILVAAIAAYPYNDPDDPPPTDPVEIRAEAEKLLREAASMAPSLSSQMNRINIYLNIAVAGEEVDRALSWTMLNAAGDDIKRLLAQIDIETNRRDATSGITGRRGRNNGLRSKTSAAFGIRKRYVVTLAGFAPDQARAFAAETAEMLTNEGLRRRATRDDRGLESDIAKKVAMNDVGKAVELGKEKLKRGVSSELVSITDNVYKKDPARGAELAVAVLDKLRGAEVDPSRAWIVTRFFQSAIRYADASVPMLGSREMRDLSSLLTTYVIHPKSRYTSLPPQVLKTIDQHSNGAAARITSVFEERTRNRETERASRVSSEGASGIAAQNDWTERRENARKYREGLNGLFDEVADPESAEDEVKEAIARAREAILSADDDGFRFENLAELAVRSHKAGEEEEAVSLMKEAEMYVASSPKQRADFSASLTIANAYSVVDPDKSFAILEDMIYRLNGVIDGYVRFAEYSSNGMTVENGELIMNRYSKQFTGYFDLAPNVVTGLAAHDAERLGDLAARFDRPELSVELKLTLAGALLKAVD